MQKPTNGKIRYLANGGRSFIATLYQQNSIYVKAFIQHEMPRVMRIKNAEPGSLVNARGNPISPVQVWSTRSHPMALLLGKFHRGCSHHTACRSSLHNEWYLYCVYYPMGWHP